MYSCVPTQWCPSLCDSMDCNPPDSFIQGSNPGSLHWEHGVLATGPPGKSLAVFNKADHAFLLKTLSFRILLPLFFFLSLSLSTWIPKGTFSSVQSLSHVRLFFIYIQNKTQYPSSKFVFLHTYLLTESACNVGDLGLIPGLGRSPGGRDTWQPTPVFLPGESHGQRSLAGCSP